MREAIARHRPPNMTQEDWLSVWNHSTDQFQALANVLTEMKKGLERVDPKDFALPNHYEKLVWQGAQVAVIDKVLELFPESIDK